MLDKESIKDLKEASERIEDVLEDYRMLVQECIDDVDYDEQEDIADLLNDIESSLDELLICIPRLKIY